MALIINGQVGWWSGTVNATPSVPTLWSSIYSVYNADSVGSSSLKTSLFAVYNGESNANDSYGSNNGIERGGLTYTTGKIGNAFNGNGTTSYVSLANNALNSLTGDFSFSFWVNLSTNSGAQAVLWNKTYDGTNFYGWSLINNNQFWYFAIGNGTNDIKLQSSAPAQINTWYHIVVTRLGSTRSRMYINGILVDSNTSTINPNFNSNMRPSIGAADFGPTYSNLVSYYLSNNSKIDALNIWNREITAAEVTELYNSGNGAQYITNDFYKPTTNDELNLRNGTPQGGLTYGVGKVGTAFQFNGSNAYVSYANDAFKFTGDFSINLWVNIASPTTNSVFIQNYFFQGGSGEAGYILEHTSAGNIRFYMLTTPSSSTQLNYNYVGKYSGWHMLTITKLSGSGACKMYVDGTLVLTNNSPGAIYYNSFNYSNIGVAKYVGGASGYVENGGKIDAVSLWNKELTATEITELYNSGNGKQYSN